MKYLLLLSSALILAGCQSVPNVQPPILSKTQDKPIIVVRHNGGVQDGACPMWVKVDGIMKGTVERNQILSVDVENGIRSVSLGRSASGVYGAGTICIGGLNTPHLVSRDVEVTGKPIKLAYDMQGTAKRWIPVVGIFLPPTPVLMLDEGQN